jgi:hypothetical protein
MNKKHRWDYNEGGGTGVPGEKHDPVTLHPTQFSHDLTWD